MHEPLFHEGTTPPRRGKARHVHRRVHADVAHDTRGHHVPAGRLARGEHGTALYAFDRRPGQPGNAHHNPVVLLHRHEPAHRDRRCLQHYFKKSWPGNRRRHWAPALSSPSVRRHALRVWAGRIHPVHLAWRTRRTRCIRDRAGHRSTRLQGIGDRAQGPVAALVSRRPFTACVDCGVRIQPAPQPSADSPVYW